MDKDSDERMAPALHTTEHEPVIKHNFTISPSSTPTITGQERNLYEQINGGFTKPLDISGTISATDSIKDSNHHLSVLECKAHTKLGMSCPNITGSGDKAAPTRKDGDVDISSLLPVNLAAGDGPNTVKTNGWSTQDQTSNIANDLHTDSLNTRQHTGDIVKDISNGPSASMVTPQLDLHSSHTCQTCVNTNGTCGSLLNTQAGGVHRDASISTVSSTCRKGLITSLGAHLPNQNYVSLCRDSKIPQVASSLSVDSRSHPESKTEGLTLSVLSKPDDSKNNGANISKNVLEILSSVKGEIHSGNDENGDSNVTLSNSDTGIHTSKSIISSNENTITSSDYQTDAKCDSLNTNMATASTSIDTFSAVQTESSDFITPTAEQLSTSLNNNDLSHIVRTSHTTNVPATVVSTSSTSHGTLSTYSIQADTSIATLSQNKTVSSQASIKGAELKDNKADTTSPVKTNKEFVDVASMTQPNSAATSTSCETSTTFENMNSPLPTSEISQAPSTCTRTIADDVTVTSSSNLPGHDSSICDSHTPIPTHCVQPLAVSDNNETDNANGSSTKDTEMPLNVPDIVGLAHGLITGNHMQNLPLKLTNTLQELAASLTRRSTLDGVSEKDETSRVDGSRRRSSSAKSLNFESDSAVVTSTGRITNTEEIGTRHRQQNEDIITRKHVLEKRLLHLATRLNKLRATGVAKHTRKQLVTLAACKPSDNVSISHVSDNGFNPIWKKILKEKGSEKSHVYENTDAAIKTEPNYNSNTEENVLKKKPEDPSSKTGILRKELHSTRVRFDPDLTDSSSDEETFENTKQKSGLSSYQDSKTVNTLPIEKTAVWTWSHDRTSIACRWVWLQAQVSELEFKIRQHNELYRQLRAAKGDVVLGHQVLTENKSLNDSNVPPTPMQMKSNTTQHHKTPVNKIHRFPVGNPPSTKESPCNINQLVSNINRQTLNLLDNLSPLSVGSPSPISTNQKPSLDSSDKVDKINTDSPSLPPSEKQCSAARTRPLKYPLRQRRVVHAADVSFLSKKPLKPPTVYNDSSIMCGEYMKQTAFHRGDGRSLEVLHGSICTRAALHDHSYHKILSTPEDIPLSLRLNGFLMTNNKRFGDRNRKSESQSDKKNKKKMKEAKRKEERLLERMKSRPRSATVVLERADKLIRSVSALHRNSSMEDRSSFHEPRKRRGSVQMMSEFNKRHRMMSVDSDGESSQQRSEAGTPTPDSSLNHSSNPQYQAVLKRKRTSDQAYDINNIVIPHGLTTTRIEKLQYKEILTPGWRETKDSVEKKVEVVSEQSEDQSDSAYQSRHDHYEIIEKKKYMAYVEWNINKKNGSRSMSRANLPLDEEAASFFYPSSFRASPTTPLTPELLSPASPQPLVTPIGMRSRRASSDHSTHNPTSQPADKHRPRDSVSSDDGATFSRETSYCGYWDARNFPLNDADYEELMKEPVVRNDKPPTPLNIEPENSFRPIVQRHTSQDTNTAPKHKIFKSTEQPTAKRRRTESQASVLSRDDDRHSDDSTTSSTFSSRRVYSKKNDSAQRSSPVTTLTAHPRRHKPVIKDDFYVYSDLNSDTESSSDDSDDQSLISEDDKPHTNKSSSRSAHWVAKPILSRESTPKRASTSGDEYTTVGSPISPNQKGPLLLKIKKK